MNVTSASCDRFTEREREKEKGRLPRVQLDEQPWRFELRSAEDDDDGVEDVTGRWKNESYFWKLRLRVTLRLLSSVFTRRETAAAIS